MQKKENNQIEWKMFERIDCLDKHNKWLDARIIDLRTSK